MRLIAFACLLPLGLAAQPQAATDSLGSIEGRVVNALTGEPVKKATLTLAHSEPPPRDAPPRSPYTTVTSSDGQFAMKDIEPGAYYLSALRSGFLRASYGASRPQQRGAILRLNSGQNVKDVNFRLTPQGVVSGRVVDEDGDPVVNAEIQLLRLRYAQGRKQLLPQPPMRWPGAATNDLGEYRLFDLEPGRYALAVTYHSEVNGAIDHSATPRNQEDYLQTYYPGTTDANAAILFDVGAGAEVGNVDIRLVKAHAVTVRGRVVNNALPGTHPIMVTLMPHNVGMGPRLGGAVHPTDAQGRFEVRGVVPGSYQLHAQVVENNKSYQAQRVIEVHDEDVDNLDLTIALGVTLPVRVQIDGSSAIELDRLGFNLVSTNTDGGYYARFRRDQPDIHFENVDAGHYNLQGNLPEGYYLKSAHSGNVDVLASGLEVGTDPPSPLDVVLSSNVGRIDGVVQNSESQQPAPFSTVVLVPQENARRDNQGYYRTVTADRYGAFIMKNLSPGEYKLYAWDEVEDGAYMDSDFLKPFASRAQPVSVKENSQLTEQVSLIVTTGASASASSGVQ